MPLSHLIRHKPLILGMFYRKQCLKLHVGALWKEVLGEKKKMRQKGEKSIARWHFAKLTLTK